MSNPLISIIIPAFNVESYIQQALESCQSQSYQNIEMLVVNDGSTDRTGEILHKLELQDKRISVIEQSNQGVSSARNKGLKRMHGDFFLFLDADDWLEPDAVESLLNAIHGFDGYIAASNRFFVKLDGDKVIKTLPDEHSAIHNTPVDVPVEKALKTIGTDKYSLQSSCYKLYPSWLITQKNILFAEDIHFGEDGLFVYECVRDSNGLIYIQKPLWNIVSREDSATNSRFNEKWITAIVAVDRMIAMEKDPQFIALLNGYKLRRILGVMHSCYMADPYDRKSERYLKETLRSFTNCEAFKNVYMKYRIYTLIYSVVPGYILHVLWKLLFKRVRSA